MRISDWSSDGCSSDLISRIATDIGQAQEIAWTVAEVLAKGDPVAAFLTLTGLAPITADLLSATASAFMGPQFSTLPQPYTTVDRHTLVQGKCVPVRFDLGGRRFLKKKKKQSHP